MDFPTLSRTPMWAALSARGKRIFLPQGIFYWAGRAKDEGDFNATVGSAGGAWCDVDPAGIDANVVYYLPVLTEKLSIDTQKVVSYAPIPGVPAFRKAWKSWILKKCPISNPDLVSLPIVVPAITSGIYFTALLFLDPGEAIVCPNKRWGNYDNIYVQNLELKIESFEFFAGQQFNAAGFKEALMKVGKTQDKVVTIVNFPNNPTGYVPTPTEKEHILGALKESADALRKPIVVILDDAYEGYVYDDQREKVSIFRELVNFHEMVIPIKMDGLSKEFFAYGARVGAITLGAHENWVPKDEIPVLFNEWENKVSGLLRSSISNSNRAFQEIAAELLEKEGMTVEAQREKISKVLAERCTIMNDGFTKKQDLLVKNGMSVDPNAGGFFLFLNLPTTIPGAKFADHLLKTHKVGTIPIEKPQVNVNGIRIAYCSLSAKDIPEVVDRIFKAIESYPK